MPLDREAFRRGYLYAMAEEGYPPEKLAGAIQKRASDQVVGGMTKQAIPEWMKLFQIEVQNLAKAPGTLLKGLANAAQMGTAGVIGTGLVGGVGGGYLAYQLGRKNYKNKLKELELREKKRTIQQAVLDIQRRTQRETPGRSLQIGG